MISEIKKIGNPALKTVLRISIVDRTELAQAVKCPVSPRISHDTRIDYRRRVTTFDMDPGRAQ